MRRPLPVWRPLARAVLLLGLLALPLRAQGAATEEARRDAREILVEGLEDYARWCKKEKLFLESWRVHERILVVDPDHGRARRELGHKKRKGQWVVPADPRIPENRGEEALAEAPERYREAVGPFSDALLSLFAQDLTPTERESIELEILRFDPQHELVRELRGEVQVDGQWYLRETIDGRARRRELEGWLEESRAELPAVASVEPDETQRGFGIALNGVELEGLRVFASSGREEAEAMARSLIAVRDAFRRLFRVHASLPEGCTIYLLSGESERDRFLGAHPAVTAEARDGLRRLQGTGIPGSVDWAYWSEDRARRSDGIVRIGAGWLVTDAFGVTWDVAWLFEGLGVYFTELALGTRSTWFVGPARAADAEAHAGLFEPGVDWMVEARTALQAEDGPRLEAVFEQTSSGIDPAALVVGHALVAYLVEARSRDAALVFSAIGRGRTSREVFEEAGGADLEVLRRRLRHWVVERTGEPPRELVVSATPAEARAAWAELRPKQKEEVVKAYGRLLDSLQSEPLERLRAFLAVHPDPADPPEPPALETFDPLVHAPNQPVRRKWLETDDDRYLGVWHQVLGESDERAPRLSWRYVWGQGEVVRGEPLEADDVFANALNGFPPELDRARALILAALDGGHQRKSLYAFGHAYTDREGKAYPGITIYQAWRSGMQVEMPDVDTLGIVHTVLDDWETWTDPVPGTSHDALYGRLGELHRDAKRYRELRETVADVFLVGTPPCPPGYESTLTNLHSLWSHHDEDLGRIATELPLPGEWESFLEGWIGRCRSEDGLYVTGLKRQTALEAGADEVRKAFLVAMEQTGALR